MKNLTKFGINLAIAYVVILLFEEFLQKASSSDYLFSSGTMRWMEFNQFGVVERYFKVWPWFFECLGENTFIGVAGVFKTYEILIWIYVAYWWTYKKKKTTKESQ